METLQNKCRRHRPNSIHKVNVAPKCFYNIVQFHLFRSIQHYLFTTIENVQNIFCTSTSYPSPWHISGSMTEQQPHTWLCQSCTYAQSQAPEDHLGQGQSAESKQTEEPAKILHFSIDYSRIQNNNKKYSSTLDIVRAGLHCSLRMSRQMLPLLLILGW